MDILEIMNLKIKSTEITEEDKEIAILEVEQAIKNYCNINKVPEELKFVWANMAVDLVRYTHLMNSTDQGIDITDIHVGDVASLSIGDTSINLGEGSSTNPEKLVRKSHLPNLDEIVMNNRAHLNKFRRMVW